MARGWGPSHVAYLCLCGPIDIPKLVFCDPEDVSQIENTDGRICRKGKQEELSLIVFLVTER